MAELDFFFRGAAIGAVLPVATAFWRSRPNSSFAWCGLLWLIGYAGFLLAGCGDFSSWRPLVQLVVVILSLSPPFFFWLFARIVFDDEFRLRPLHFVWLALIEGDGIALAVLWQDSDPRLRSLLGLVFRLLALGLVAHTFWLVWRGRRADLVDARARLRVGVVIGIAVVGSAILLAGIIYGPVEMRPPSIKLGEAVAYLLVSVATSMALTQLDASFLPSIPHAAPYLDQLGFADEVDPAFPAIAGADADSFARLAALMSHDEVWRESGLTVGKLASRVGIAEYRLRRLINQGLGYRNFTAFLNEYRLAAAARQLKDLERQRVSILTIALDLGWGSIGPFNRAFRARFDVSPSDYRRAEMTRAPGPGIDDSSFEKPGRFQKRRD